MKRQHLSMIVTLPIALALACAANAQQTPQTQPPNQQPQPQTQQNAPMQNRPMQTAPTTSSQTMQCAAGTNCYDNNTTDRDSNSNRMRNGTADFSTLAGSKGYVTQADTSGHRWLASHFNQCDSNHDGKLSHSEYDACRTQH